MKHTNFFDEIDSNYKPFNFLQALAITIGILVVVYALFVGITLSMQTPEVQSEVIELLK